MASPSCELCRLPRLEAWGDRPITPCALVRGSSNITENYHFRKSRGEPYAINSLHRSFQRRLAIPPQLSSGGDA